MKKIVVLFFVLFCLSCKTYYSVKHTIKTLVKNYDMDEMGYIRDSLIFYKKETGEKNDPDIFPFKKP